MNDSRFTGTIRSEIVTDPRTGERCRQIFEYENGECVDRYVTILWRATHLPDPVHGGDVFSRIEASEEVPGA